MRYLNLLLILSAVLLCVNADAADKKKKKKKEPLQLSSYHYIRLCEPVRVNVIKTSRSREDTDVAGVKVSGFNIADSGKLNGFELGFFCACAKLEGFQFGLFSCLSDDLSGFQWGMFHNYAKKFSGLQLSFVNRAGEHSGGWQIGIVNFSDKNGIQFGLLNFKEDGFLPIFPLINF